MPAGSSPVAGLVYWPPSAVRAIGAKERAIMVLPGQPVFPGGGGGGGDMRDNKQDHRQDMRDNKQDRRDDKRDKKNN
jgi:hypothetical protein